MGFADGFAFGACCFVAVVLVVVVVVAVDGVGVAVDVWPGLELGFPWSGATEVDPKPARLVAARAPPTLRTTEKDSPMRRANEIEPARWRARLGARRPLGESFTESRRPLRIRLPRGS